MVGSRKFVMFPYINNVGLSGVLFEVVEMKIPKVSTYNWLRACLEGSKPGEMDNFILETLPS